MTVTSYKSSKFLDGFLVSPKTSEQKVYCECVCAFVYSLSVELRQGVCVCVLSVS